MLSRWIRLGWALLLSAPLLAPAIPVAPASAEADCPTRASACCCDPCPGPPVCPCDHGAPVGEASCANGTEDDPLTAGSAVSSPPIFLACEWPVKPSIRISLPLEAGTSAAPSPPIFADPPGKIPIA